ncbi:MAG TPA: tetratricopeptide repeat protein [Rhizobiaceae bacterium]|nr:tetratricopeptide repeat protein [Rhizobiaceae bacterium]
MSTKLALKPIGKNAHPKKILKQIHALQGLGRFQESRVLCDRLIGLGYDNPDFLHLYGLVLRGCDDLPNALVAIHAAHEQKPQDASILNSMGAIFLQMNDVEPAIELFKRATKIDQKYYSAWLNLGIALKRAERYEAADLALTCAHHIDPGKIEPLLNLVDILIERRLYKRAEEFADKLLERQTDITPRLQLKRLHIAARLQDLAYIKKHRETADVGGFSQDERAELDNIWVHCLEIESRYEEGIAVLEGWMDKSTQHRTQLQTQLGLFYAAVGRLDDSTAVHEDLLRAHPDHVGGRYNLARLQFRKGELSEGFANYEARWQWREFTTLRRRFSAPRWEGEPLDGKNLLVWREQGIGDEVRYASLLPELKDLGGSVTFECSPKLAPLFERSFPWAKIRHEGPLECRGDEAYAGFDYQIPVGSLGKMFRPSVASFHERQAFWLARFPEAENRVRAQIDPASDEIVVGICWRSSNRAASRNRYFFEPEQLAPLRHLPKVRWLNLQYDGTVDEVETIRNLGIPLHHYTNVDQKDDLVSACALLGACDLVVSIGSAVADLTGGLGVPTVYMTRHDSEVYLGTDHVPWFPAAKPFPMKANRGDETIEKIVSEWPSIVDWARSAPTARQPRHAEVPARPASSKALCLDLVYEHAAN